MRLPIDTLVTQNRFENRIYGRVVGYTFVRTVEYHKVLWPNGLEGWFLAKELIVVYEI